MLDIYIMLVAQLHGLATTDDLPGGRANSLRELLWLKDLGKLKNLWLAENPCCGGGGNEKYVIDYTF